MNCQMAQICMHNALQLLLHRRHTLNCDLYSSIIAHPHLAIYENGELRYEIYRQAYGDQEAFEVPVPQAAAKYTASVDNMGGVVSAYTYE